MINIFNLRKGIERSFWQSEWFGIKFTDLNCNISFTSVSNSEFYDIFYTKLFLKYHSMDHLPREWRNEKLATATHLNSLISSNARVLSCGCGLGFIEQFFLQSRGDISLVATDYSTVISGWIKKMTNINYKRIIPINETFDVIYLSQVLYSLNFDEAVDLLKVLKGKMSDDSYLILINTSVFPWENKEYSIILKNFLMLKWLLSSFLFLPFKKYIMLHQNKYQNWGFQRDFIMYKKIANAAGLRVVSKQPVANQQFIILKIN